MTNFSPVITCTKNVLCLSGCVGKQMSGQVINVVSQSPPSSCCFRFQSSRSQLSYARLTISKTFSCSALVSSLTFRGSCFGSGFSKQRRNWHPLTEKNLEISMGHQVTCLGISLPSQKMSLRLLTPKRETCTKVSWNVRPASRLQGGASASLIFGLFVCFSSSKPAYAEAPKKKDEDDCDSSLVNSSHGKKVYRDYYVTAIPGDGRCLFRSVAHGACIQSGKPPPSESVQRELADELRSRVADEFVKRREETEWFIEGDFDTYVSQIRKPYVWGGEPELFMASHVLQMPITVYMYDEDASGLIAIAEYGQEYGKDDPIRVLYHGYGHYEALQITGKKGGRSRM